MEYFTIQDFPQEVLIYILGSMCSYERSRVCTVSKSFEYAAIVASKRKSSHKLYYEDPSIFHKLTKMAMAANSHNRSLNIEICEAIQQMVYDCDYHLFVRLKEKIMTTGTSEAAKQGYNPVIDLMLIHASNANYAIYEAVYGSCEGGHFELFKSLFSLIKPSLGKQQLTSDDLKDGKWNKAINKLVKDSSNQNHMFYCAGVGGNRLIVDMLLKEFKILEICNEEHIDNVFVGACYGGHLELALWAVEEGATNYFDGFCEACENNQFNIVETLVNLLEESPLRSMIYEVSIKGYIDIIQCFKKNELIEDWNWVLEGACTGLKQNIIELAIDNGANSCNHCSKPIKDHLSK